MANLDDVYEKLVKIEEELEEIKPTLETVKKLQEAGLIGMIDGLAEEFDNLFNYASKMELLDLLTITVKVLEPLQKMMKTGELQRLLELLTKVDISKLMPILEAMANCSDKVVDVLEVSSRRKKKMGLMEMLNTVRSPEMAALLYMGKELSGCMMENAKKSQKK